ncbi:PIN-like domain-containing protein [Pseudokineococcus sp. 1T1Z-3]|uniref:PIN-like domain-containing protein n=1 Tax=Pseudokineococcus sp. 1T1Z-3 TaxID=3132745 RepID=UPI0030B2E4BA
MPSSAGAGHGFRFYADESVLGLGKGLAGLRRDVVHPGHPAVPQLHLGMADEAWIPVVAGLGLVAIARDKKMRTRPGERAAMLDHGLRCLWIGGKRDQSTWDWAVLLVRHWERLEASVEELGAGPWFLVLTARGLRRID